MNTNITEMTVSQSRVRKSLIKNAIIKIGPLLVIVKSVTVIDAESIVVR